MKEYKFKFLPSVKILLAIITLVCLGGVAFNTYNLINYVKVNSFRIWTTGVILLVNLALTIFIIMVILNSKYKILNDKIVLRFGFFKSIYQINEIVSFSHFKKSDKLVMYFTDAKWTVVVIAPQDYDNFIKAVRDNNSKILFSEQIEGEDTPN